jgi:hypothetical protein
MEILAREHRLVKPDPLSGYEPLIGVRATASQDTPATLVLAGNGAADVRKGPLSMRASARARANGALLLQLMTSSS